MQKKLAAYFFLSLLSFTFFTFIFHTVVDAQTTTPEFSQDQNAPEVPTPTVYGNQPVAPPANTQPAVISTPASYTAVPTPTVYLIQTKEETPTELAQAEAAHAATPTPEPTDAPKPTMVVAVDLESLISKYADMYHVDKEEMKKIAKCESGFNANAQNGPYTGMFQFDASTWIAERSRMGLDTNPDLRTNAEEAIRTTAHKISISGLNAWPVCH